MMAAKVPIPICREVISPRLLKIANAVAQKRGPTTAEVRDTAAYTPNFSHFEVNTDGSGWKKVGERWTWLFQSGRNDLRVRAVSKAGVCGKPSTIVINHADAPFAQVR